ncbi:hypothetical protein PAXRUDRAFT_163425 [Paxillus rubicundulus Ve08.2h10]|uniref:Uncharacterized protein n=1 Tax=Paxillus rubicundulus Ve08.2h10 TaxID=930991 RepID=A0A0D0CTC1_9AGAM|nr:hypothetical protein PAXRUDRAFT_163425 [Paxillus rubicundulus Ve08.2h10]
MYRLEQSAHSSPTSSVNSSPSSSPILGPADSSPAPSPQLDPISLDSPPLSSVPLLHPFAASTKAIGRHPNYEKKTGSPPITPSGAVTRSAALYRSAGCSRSLQEDEYLSSCSSNTVSPSHRTSRYIDREERIWEDALRKPFDTGNGRIDISNQELKTIPTSVGDLSGFFNTPELSEQTLFSGRSLARVNTEPDFQSSRVRSFERTQSIKDSGKERHVLQLYLASNKISYLPPELFIVQNLTVLSLRGNKITFIPPDICRLTNLRELNISFNQLTYLPSEMRDMKIDKLSVNPNPFILEPSRTTSPLVNFGSSRPTLGSRRSITRLHSMRREAAVSPPEAAVLSSITFSLPQIPPLTELCLRLLLAPSGGSSKQSIIAEYYGLPLPERWEIPLHLCTTLVECVPGILRPYKRSSFPDVQHVPTDTGTSTCPNPEHKGRIFVKHASERFSWERRIAGVDVGGAVPLRWRGCLRSCLDFLEVVKAEPTNDIKVPTLSAAQSMEMDLDMEQVLQAVDLGSGGLDMHDFDD